MVLLTMCGGAQYLLGISPPCRSDGRERRRDEEDSMDGRTDGETDGELW